MDTTKTEIRLEQHNKTARPSKQAFTEHLKKDYISFSSVCGTFSIKTMLGHKKASINLEGLTLHKLCSLITVE